MDASPIIRDEKFTDIEASALCKAKGFYDGKVEESIVSDEPTSGLCLSCLTPNLDNCKLKICNKSILANFTCGNKSEIQLIGGVKPGEGHILFNSGMICDDYWDIEVNQVPEKLTDEILKD